VYESEGEMAVVIVQINGKRRGELTLAPDTTEGDALNEAIQNSTIRAYMGGARPKRVVYVPGRILNIVV
jgi:leucyl-tRNA synthetase